MSWVQNRCLTYFPSSLLSHFNSIRFLVSRRIQWLYRRPELNHPNHSMTIGPWHLSLLLWKPSRILLKSGFKVHLGQNWIRSYRGSRHMEDTTVTLLDKGLRPIYCTKTSMRLFFVDLISVFNCMKSQIWEDGLLCWLGWSHPSGSMMRHGWVQWWMTLVIGVNNPVSTTRN